MSLTNEIIKQKVEEKFGESVKAFTEDLAGMLTFEVDRNKVIDLMQFLRDDETLRFNFLTTLGGVHYPDNQTDSQFAVVYHMHNWLDNVRIRFKTFLNGENPEVATATGLFLTANWMERETYDFFGIIFTGHPDLRRILNMDEMVSFPMRKEFPLEDGGRTDKDDRYFGREPLNRNLN
jgi:NADH-quinone oxidoreductase subunit C